MVFDALDRVYGFQFNLPNRVPLAAARAMARKQVPPKAHLRHVYDQADCFNEQFSNPLPSDPNDLMSNGQPFLISLTYFSSSQPGSQLDKARVSQVVFMAGTGDQPECG